MDVGDESHPQATATPVLRASGVKRSFGRRKVLRGVSIELEAGAILVVTGANGAGKTTLLDILAAAARPDAGEVSIAGNDAVDDPGGARAAVGYLPDSFPLYEELTPVENLQLVARLRGHSAGLKGILEALGKAGLAGRAEDPCKGLSAGQKRRLALAAATLHQPELLVMDEPLSSMDSAGRDLVVATLALRRERMKGACVVATHDPGAVAAVMTHRMTLESGAGEVSKVHIDEAVRSVDRAGAISLVERR